jgi:hypothetical protein
MEPATLAAALGFALTGEALPLGDATGAAAVLDALAAAGWPRERIAAHAAARRAAAEPWPHAVADLPPGVGFAQHLAGVEALVHALGLDTEAQPPSRRTALNADERRLLIDKPPHWG